MTSNPVSRVQFLNSSSDFTGACSSFWLLIDTNIHKRVADVENLVCRRISAVNCENSYNSCLSTWAVQPLLMPYNDVSEATHLRVNLFLNGGLLPSDESSQIIRDGDLISVELVKLRPLNPLTRTTDIDGKNVEVDRTVKPKATKSKERKERKEKKKNPEAKSEQLVQLTKIAKENTSHDCGMNVPLTEQELVNQLVREQTGKGRSFKDSEMVSKTQKIKICEEKVEKKLYKSNSTDAVDIEAPEKPCRKNKHKKRREKCSEESYESADNSHPPQQNSSIVPIENQQLHNVANESRQKRRRKRRKVSKKKEPVQYTPLPTTNTYFRPLISHVKNKKIVFPDSDTDIQNPVPGLVIPETAEKDTEQVSFFESLNDETHESYIDCVLGAPKIQAEQTSNIRERKVEECNSYCPEIVNAGCYNSVIAVKEMVKDGQQQESEPTAQLETLVDTNEIASEAVTKCSENAEFPLEDNKPVNYESLADLKSLPRLGDRIAFKILELTESVCPQVSEYMEAKVTSVDDKTEHVQLKMLKSMVHENILISDNNSADDGTILIAFKHLYSPKLMMDT